MKTPLYTVLTAVIRSHWSVVAAWDSGYFMSEWWIASSTSLSFYQHPSATTSFSHPSADDRKFAIVSDMASAIRRSTLAVSPSLSPCRHALDLSSCSLRPAAQHPGRTWPDGTRKPNNNHANHKPGIRNSKRIQDPELGDLEFGDLPSQYPREYPICNVLNCPQGILMPFLCALAGWPCDGLLFSS